VIREERSYRVEIILVLATALLTSVGSFIVTQIQLRTQSSEKQHEVRLSYLERLQKEVTEYQREAYIWFFAYLDSAQGAKATSYDEKHAAYHRDEASLQSTLRVLPFFFGNEVKAKVADLSKYLDEQGGWEARVQTDEVYRRAQNLPKSKTVTDLVAETVNSKEYYAKTEALISAMAKEIADD
jgi:heme/copper-type cytochrome/quinol oxidase subunit 2